MAHRTLLAAVFALVFLPGVLAAQGEGEDDSALRREVADLVKALGSEDFNARMKAYEGLQALGRRALPYLTPWLESDDPEVARLVRRHVEGLERRAEEDLLAALDVKQDGFEKSEELEKIVARGREMLPSLYRVIADEDRHYPSYSYYRLRNAYTAVGRLVTIEDLDVLLSRLARPNPQHQYLLRPILEGMDREKVLAACFKRLADDEESPQVRSQLLAMCWNTSFTGNDERVPKIAVGLLSNESPVVRTAALRYFGMRRDEAVLPKLLELAKDEDGDVRAAALRTLRNYRTPEVATLVKAALRDPVAAVRAAALETMRNTVQPDAAPIIRPFLKDPDPTVRSNAAQALGMLGDKTALPTLLELLSEREDEFLNRTLFSILDAVGRIGDPAALKPLWKLLETADEVQQIGNYRYKILTAIVQSGGVGVLDEIRPHLKDSDLKNRNIVLDAVAKLESEKVIPILTDALTNGDTHLRTSAVRGLAARNHAEAAPGIAKLLDAETDFWFLSEAVNALAVFDHRDAVPAMRKLLDEGDPTDTRRTSLYYALIRAFMKFRVADAAPRILALATGHKNYRYVGVDALGRLGNEEVVPGLVELYEGEENDSVRHRIALALARLGKTDLLEKRLEGISEGDYRRIDALIALGRYADARKIVSMSLAGNPDDGTQLYNLGCLYSLEGEIDKAFPVLEKALKLRNFTKQQLATDPDLDAIREDPRFLKLLEKAR